MKTFPQTRILRQRRRSGVALVMVLAMLVLLSALLVAFMTSATTESTSAQTYSRGAEARQAAETAVNMVIGQIRQATGGEVAQSGTQSGFAWASQPGAIRTFGKTAGQNKVYKLYSSDVMQVNESAYLPANEAAFSLTEPDPKLGYVDLNEPLLLRRDVGSGEPYYEPRYPIINPYAKYKLSPSSTAASTKFNLAAEPTTPGDGVVEGFYCSDQIDNAHKDVDGQNIRLLPMRVKWIYTLRDGTLAQVDTDGRIKGATKENPPVSRVAYWTDDESSKINVNTGANLLSLRLPDTGDSGVHAARMSIPGADRSGCRLINFRGKPKKRVFVDRVLLLSISVLVDV